MQFAIVINGLVFRLLLIAMCLFFCCISLAQVNELKTVTKKIESELSYQRFEQAVLIAEAFFKLNPEAYTLVAYTYIVAGEHDKALSILDSTHGKYYREQGEKAIVAHVIEDFEYTHCFVPWLLRVNAFFALRDWNSLTHAIERLERVSYPNPISGELVYYDYSFRQSGVRSLKLDSLVVELLNKESDSPEAKLISAMHGIRQTVTVKPRNSIDAALVLTMHVLNAEKLIQAETSRKILQAANSTLGLTPALDGASLHLSVLRALIRKN